MLHFLIQVKKEETGTIHVIKQRQLHLSCDIISLSVSTQDKGQFKLELQPVMHVCERVNEMCVSSVKALINQRTRKDIHSMSISVITTKTNIFVCCCATCLTCPPAVSVSLQWINSRTLVLVDSHEKLQVVDRPSQEVLETLDLEQVQLVYNSRHFKSLATGGNVSQALVRDQLMGDQRSSL